jgi:hypothetical protein
MRVPWLHRARDPCRRRTSHSRLGSSWRPRRSRSALEPEAHHHAKPRAPDEIPATRSAAASLSTASLSTATIERWLRRARLAVGTARARGPGSRRACHSHQTRPLPPPNARGKERRTGTRLRGALAARRHAARALAARYHRSAPLCDRAREHPAASQRAAAAPRTATPRSGRDRSRGWCPERPPRRRLDRTSVPVRQTAGRAAPGRTTAPTPMPPRTAASLPATADMPARESAGAWPEATRPD